MVVYMVRSRAAFASYLSFQVVMARRTTLHLSEPVNPYSVLAALHVSPRKPPQD